jgi:hypothetical protein
MLNIRSSKLLSVLIQGVLFSQVSCTSTARQEDYDLQEQSSPFDSTVPGLSIRNAHVVVGDNAKPRLIRSQAPNKDHEYTELKDIGVTDVLIFKKETRNEVKKEIAKLLELGIKEERVRHISFLYKDFPDFETPCRQTIEALEFMQLMRTKSSRKLLFHCTVGEDRTGYLAGIVRLMSEKISVEEVFKQEMCKNGYSSGNPNKPGLVTSAIDRDLTPVFLKMAYLIKKGRIKWKSLDPEVCSADPADSDDFTAENEFKDLKRFRCKS